jgi:plasmid stabilization system protein ParE
MVYSVTIEHRAEIEIDEAFIGIFELAPDAAIRWYRQVAEEMHSLSEMPNRCALAPESEKLGFELRQLVFGKRSGRYRIVFRVLDDRAEVHIVAVRHGARKPLEPEDFE